MAFGSSEFNSADNRSKRLQQVMDLFRSALDEGREIDDSAFFSEYSDLMPELAVQIRMLRRIRKVDAGSDGGNPMIPALDFNDGDVRRFLKENLPGYSIQDAISRGGQGLVFRAIQLSTHRDVAIKVLADGVFASRQQLDRFIREIELAARLRHPNIVSIYDSGTVRNRPYCVMEYVDGEPVDDYVLLEQPDLRGRVELFARICRAVSYAHQQGVIHRDLKPANILVDARGEPRLLDFGLAKDAFALEAGGAGLSMPGQVIGTLEYLSPEQIRGIPGEIDVRTDIYALGLVFYKVLTGDFPYPAKESYDGIRQNILESSPTPFRSLPSPQAGNLDPHEIDADVEAILRKALEKDKSRRYQSADAMADDFERFLRHEIVLARADTRFYIFRKTLRRYRIQLAVAAGFVVLATVAAVISTSQYFRAAQQRDRANDAASLAQSVTTQVLTEIDDVVSRLAGGQAARDRILSGIQQRLEDLVGVLEDVGGVEHDRALLHLNLGKIAARKGDRLRAAGEFQLVVDTVAGADKPDALTAPLVIDGLIGLGGVVDDPGQVLAKAVDLASARAAEFPRDDVYKVLLCEAEVRRAFRAETSGDKSLAVMAADRALGAFEFVLPDSPYYARAARAAVDAHDCGGRCRRWLGECDKSEWHCDVALGLLKGLISRNPADCLTRYRRMLLFNRFAGMSNAVGDTDAALTYLDQAISDGEFLCNADPGEFEWSLSLVHAYLARAQFSLMDDIEESSCAVEKFRQRLVILETLSPGDRRVLYLKAFLMVAEARIESSRGHSRKSIRMFSNAADIFWVIESAEKDQSDSEPMFAYCIGQIGKLYLQHRSFETAQSYLEYCLELRMEQYASEPESLDRLLRLMETRFDLIQLTGAVGDFAEMEHSMTELDHMDDLLAKLETSGLYRCHIPRITKLRGALGSVKKEIEKKLK